MDTEKLKEVAKVLQGIDLTFESDDAKDVAKKYLVLKFIDDQIKNIIWLPCALTVAFVLYCFGKWLIGQI